MNDTIAGQAIIVLYDSAARTGVAYLCQFDGQTLEFYNANEEGYELRDKKPAHCGMSMAARSRALMGEPG